MIQWPMAILVLSLVLGQTSVGAAAPPIEIDRSTTYQVELSADSPVGEASIREHAIAWHPVKKKYYLVADVVPLSSVHHPNTYETQLHLWSSTDLTEWRYHGVAVEKGKAEQAYDRHGVASPAGMAYLGGKLHVPFSARRTSRFEKRGIGLAISHKDPEELPWEKTSQPVSDLVGEDDDPAVLSLPDDDSLHLYHRRTGPEGYGIVHTQSKTPSDPSRWPAAVIATARPKNVRAQELTGAFVSDDKVQLLVIEHFVGGGTGIAHLVSIKPSGPFNSALPNERYLPSDAQAARLAYSGHITPVVRNGAPIAFFWTVPQKGKRYGLLGHPVLQNN